MWYIALYFASPILAGGVWAVRVYLSDRARARARRGAAQELGTPLLGWDGATIEDYYLDASYFQH